jgi:hypothetical protein
LSLSERGQSPFSSTERNSFLVIFPFLPYHKAVNSHYFLPFFGKSLYSFKTCRCYAVIKAFSEEWEEIMAIYSFVTREERKND